MLDFILQQSFDTGALPNADWSTDRVMPVGKD